VKPLRAYDVSFTGLKEGKHVFEFALDDTFFTIFDNSELNAGQVDVTIVMEKRSTMLILNFDLKGSVTTMCDHCTDNLVIEVENSNRIIVKFGAEGFEETDEIVVLQEKEHSVNVAQFMLEFIELAMPVRRIHPEGQCNEAMLKTMSEYLTSEDISESEDFDEDDDEDDDDIDPRWDALKGLSDND
jgi:uncharacterized metal-binding protein YceD (DUF177 family)